MKYITKEEYFDKAKKYHSVNWKNAKRRWQYHDEAIRLLQSINPKSVLEAGNMGMQLCDSDTIDYEDSGWELFYTPTYNHNLKVLPWPVRSYDAFVALRVFHHLVDKPKQYLSEMMRISNHIILALSYDGADVYRKVKKPNKEIRCDNFRTIILYYGSHFND